DACLKLLIELRSLVNLFRSQKANLFVSGADDVQWPGEARAAGLGDRSEHRGERALHVTAAASVEPAVAFDRFEGSVAIVEPIVCGNDVAVAEVSQAAVSGLALAADDVHLAHAVRVVVLDSLGLKTKRTKLLF